MSRAQQVWGLTGGVLNLAVAGAFWIGLGTYGLGPYFYIALVTSIAYSSVLVVRSFTLRRRHPGFSLSDVRAAPSGSPTHRMSVGFRAVSLAQVISIGSVVTLCSWLGRTDLVWPLIGLIVSLHLAPLGLLFGVPAYYVVAAIGAAVSLASIFLFTGIASALVLGVGLGVPFLVCARYLFGRADTVAREATATV